MTAIYPIPLQDLIPQMVCRLFPHTDPDDLRHCREIGGDILSLLATSNDLTPSEVRETLDVFLVDECDRHLSAAA